MERKMILVVGATGNQGGAVVEALLQKTGFSVRAFARSAASPKAESLRKKGVEIAQGDLDNAESLAQAMRSVYGVFSALNFRDGGVGKEAERGKRIAEIAKDAGVQHFIYSSVGGAERGSNVPHFESKWQVEQHIRGIGLPFSIIRPTSFMTNLMEMPAIMRLISLSIFRGMPSAKPVQMVAVEDIGKWAAHMFLHPQQYLGKAVEIAGDEVTFDKMIAAYRKVYGKTPKSMKLPNNLFSKGDMGKMMKWMREYGYQADISANRQEIPDMLSYEQFIAKRSSL